MMSNENDLRRFIQTNIGYSLDKFIRDGQYWEKFLQELVMRISDMSSGNSANSIPKILNAPYALKKNKNKIRRNSHSIKQVQITKKTNTISLFHFLCKDMCNYWPSIHDKHFNATWKIIKLFLENGGKPLIQYKKGSKPIYSYQSILLLIDSFGRHQEKEIDDIIKQILFILSFIQNNKCHPPIFTYYSHSGIYGIQNLSTDWLYLGCKIDNKSKDYILNALSPQIIAFLLQRNHTLFEIRDKEKDYIIDNYVYFMKRMDLNLIKRFPEPMVISLCLISFILPQIHQRLFNTIYESFQSMQHKSMLSFISYDVTTIIMDYMLYSYNFNHKFNNSQNQMLLPLTEWNINESQLIQYMLQQLIQRTNHNWKQWIIDKILPQLSLSQVAKFKSYTINQDKDWNNFIINSPDQLQLLSLYGGSMYTQTMEKLIHIHCHNIDNLQTVLLLNYPFHETWTIRLLMTILKDTKLIICLI